MSRLNLPEPEERVLVQAKVPKSKREMCVQQMDAHNSELRRQGKPAIGWAEIFEAAMDLYLEDRKVKRR